MGFNYAHEFPAKSKDVGEEHEVPFRIYRPMNTLWWKIDNQSNHGNVGKDTTYIECSAYTKGRISSNFKLLITIKTEDKLKISYRYGQQLRNTCIRSYSH